MNIYLDLFLTFAKTGLVAFGGGPSMIPLIQAEVVRHGWLNDTEFVDALAMGNGLPGPIATKMSGYTGYKVAGLPGAIAATSGMAFPSMILMLGLAFLYLRYRDTTLVQGLLKGVRPAVVALLAVVVIQVWPEAMGGWPKTVREWGLIVIAAATALSVLKFQLHPALAILAAGFVGLLVYR